MRDLRQSMQRGLRVGGHFDALSTSVDGALAQKEKTEATLREMLDCEAWRTSYWQPLLVVLCQVIKNIFNVIIDGGEMPAIFYFH